MENIIFVVFEGQPNVWRTLKNILFKLNGISMFPVTNWVPRNLHLNKDNSFVYIADLAAIITALLKFLITMKTAQ